MLRSPRDYAAVKRVLAEAGYKGEKIVVMTPTDVRELGDLTRTGAEQLRRAGIDAELKTFPASEFNAPGGPLRSGRFNVAADQWIGAADPEESVVFACSQRGGNGNNQANYCNPRFDALFEHQSVTGNLGRRKHDFIEMQRIVRTDVPIVAIAFESSVDAISDRVVGFRRNMLAYPVDAPTWDVR